uniref:Uncharacterized protein n=1 Tax=Anguilla anguilla TaxID=7936 RepID=A0A0E9VN92_ANGAN
MQSLRSQLYCLRLLKKQNNSAYLINSLSALLIETA